MSDAIDNELAMMATHLAQAIPSDQTKYRYLVYYRKALTVDDYHSIFNHSIKMVKKLYASVTASETGFIQYTSRRYDLTFLRKITNGSPIPLGTWTSPRAFFPKCRSALIRDCLITSRLTEATKARFLGATVVDIYPGKPDDI